MDKRSRHSSTDRDMPQSSGHRPRTGEDSDDSSRRKNKRKKHKSREQSPEPELPKKRLNIVKKQEEPVMSIEGESAEAGNPFGDPELEKAFVWKKKLETEGLTKASKKEIKKLVEARKHSSNEELEKVRKNRLERERMRVEREEEMELLQRQKEAEDYHEWSSQESKFHLEQARERSLIRIAEGNPKPIDLLARYISSSGMESSADDLDVEMREAYSYLVGLTKRDLEDLLVDVKVYQALDRGSHDEYWRDIAIIADDELKRLKRKDPSDPAYAGNQREAINTSVNRDVTGILKGKTYPQLALLETQIMKKIQSGGPAVDVSYWESLLDMLKAHMARARLKERHKQLLQNKLYKLKQEQKVADEKPRFPAANFTGDASTVETAPDSPAPSSAPVQKPSSAGQKPGSGKGPAALCSRPWEELSEDDILKRRRYEYTDGSYSPTYVPEDSLEKGIEIVDAAEDEKRIEFRRTHKEADPTVALEAVARQGMGGDEAQFSVETPLAKKTYLWSDKYRPRKPRYFNRVHTGFEWNRYNQTHYDFDNPPPKIVQGYKFNIFYPDLLDPSEAPTFTLVPGEENPDFATLKFEAGPPYEDIAFKVINREWEISHRKGYRCQFQNGIFQLWFHFKKYRYRR